MRRVAVVAIQHPSLPNLFLHGKRRDNQKWAMPGGHANDGEAPLDNARRELREETGLMIKEMEHSRNGYFVAPEGDKVGVSLFTAQCPQELDVDSHNDPDYEFSEFKFLDPSVEGVDFHVPADRNILTQHLSFKKIELSAGKATVSMRADLTQKIGKQEGGAILEKMLGETYQTKHTFQGAGQDGAKDSFRVNAYDSKGKHAGHAYVVNRTNHITLHNFDYHPDHEYNRKAIAQKIVDHAEKISGKKVKGLEKIEKSIKNKLAGLAVAGASIFAATQAKGDVGHLKSYLNTLHGANISGHTIEVAHKDMTKPEYQGTDMGAGKFQVRVGPWVMHGRYSGFGSDNYDFKLTKPVHMQGGHSTDSSQPENYDTANLADSLHSEFVGGGKVGIQDVLSRKRTAQHGDKGLKLTNFGTMKAEDIDDRLHIRTEGRVFVAMDGDNIGASVERAAMANDLGTIIHQSKTIALGQRIIRAWAEKYNADIYIDGGDDIAMTLPKKSIKSLEVARQAYNKATGFTITVGYGDSISNAGQAMVYGKLHGKDQINKWSKKLEKELDKIVREITPKEKYAEEGLIGKEEKNAALQEARTKKQSDDGWV